MRHFLLMLGSALIIFGCARSVSTSGTSSGAGTYSEDLSIWRPEIQPKKDTAKTGTSVTPEAPRVNKYVEARLAVNDKVDTILDSIHRDNLSKGFIDGYTIQVYSGIKREDALNVRKKLSLSLPDLESDVQYRQPNFRVRTGQYLSRLEAQEDYLKVKRIFPNAIVIPDRVAIE